MGFPVVTVSVFTGAFIVWVSMRGMARDTRLELAEARREADAARLARDRWHACYRHAIGQHDAIRSKLDAVERIATEYAVTLSSTEGLLDTAEAENATLRARLSRAGQPRGERGKFAAASGVGGGGVGEWP